MLAQTERAPAGRHQLISTPKEPIYTPPALDEIGVTKKQSSNWQTLAAMSDEHFEATVEAAKDTAGEVTTAFMLREAKRPQRQTQH